jgi:outer membrane protein assembly factor BamB
MSTRTRTLLIAVAVLAALTLHRPARAADAVMYRGNAAHTGEYDGAGGFPEQRERWRFKTGNLNRSTPAVAAGVVYAGSHTGNLYALDAATGALKWQAALGGEIASSPAVADGLVYVGNDAGFYALDAQTGARKWKIGTGALAPFNHRWDYYQSSPVVEAGVVYFGSGDGAIYAAEAKSGHVLWRFQTSGRVRTAPALSGGVIYCGSMDGTLYALGARSGQLKWKFKTAGNSFFPLGEIQSSPAIADGVIYFGSRDAQLYALDAATGEKQWAYSHDGSWCISGPAVAGGMVFAGSSDGQFVNALDAKTGAEKWRYKTTARVFTSPAVAGGKVYFGDWSGQVGWLDAKTGKLRGGTSAEAATNGSPVIAEGVLYYASDDGYIYAVELQKARGNSAVQLAPKILDRYVGEYETSPGRPLTASRVEGKLHVQSPRGLSLDLEPESETRFYTPDDPFEFEFHLDAQGACTEVVLRQGEYAYTFKKVK